MKVYPAHLPLYLVEADVVESLEARAHDLAHTVVRYKKRLLPTHKNILPLGAVFVVEVGLLGLFSKRTPGGEPAPMLHVCLVCSSPGGMTSLEGVLGTNNLAFEIGSQRRVVFSQA